jgi:hypothetical protein
VQACTVDDAARSLLLLPVGEGAGAELDVLFRQGYTAERRGVLR